MSTETNYKVIGTRPIRHDGVDKVTGRAVYGADVQLAGLLHGRILRSPHAHAAHQSHRHQQGRWRCPASRRWSPRADLPDPGDQHRRAGRRGRQPART